jgi:hypothetical protein
MVGWLFFLLYELTGIRFNKGVNHGFESFDYAPAGDALASF